MSRNARAISPLPRVAIATVFKNPLAGGPPAQIACDTLLKLRAPTLHLRPHEILSRLFTALNLLPSMATPAVLRRPISWHSSTKRAHTLRSACPLSLRKSAIVLWSG